MATKKQVRFRRLLDRGFYPIELPPTFGTRNFSRSAESGMTWPNNRRSYSGHLIRADGATHQGHLRTFGVINPVNYAILSDFIAENWGKISSIYKITQCSGARPKFPDDEATDGRAIITQSLSSKREQLKHLASQFPYILDLDISRFYDSIYTHSIPWSVHSKAVAKQLYYTSSLGGDWSDTLDTYVRNCNDKQTIGIPIGPDTSRIVSELILSRIDKEICKSGSGINSTQLFHNIDDYQFGTYSIQKAEEVQSLFVREISAMELRLNDHKTAINSGMKLAPTNWQQNFHSLYSLTGENFLGQFFDQLYRLANDHPKSNVIGYMLKKFRFKLMNSSNVDTLVRYLQRLLLSFPHQVRWIAPIYASVIKFHSPNISFTKVLDWCLELSCRKNDVISSLWFIYLKIFLGDRIKKMDFYVCFSLNCTLMDTMLMHARHLGLISFPINEMRSRYSTGDFKTSNWFTLYNVERFGWDSNLVFQNFGGARDQLKIFESLNQSNVDFYIVDQSALSYGAFDGWDIDEAALVGLDMDEPGFADLSIFFAEDDGDPYL